MAFSVGKPEANGLDVETWPLVFLLRLRQEKGGKIPQKGSETKACVRMGFLF